MLDMNNIQYQWISMLCLRFIRSIPCPLSIGLPHEIAHGSLRISLSHENTLEEIDYTVDKVKEIVEKLRKYVTLI